MICLQSKHETEIEMLDYCEQTYILVRYKCSLG
jgi:hypothetical protein